MREQRVYDAIIDLCISKGVGKMASEIARLVAISLSNKNALVVYKALTEEFQSTREISLKTGVKSNDVSSILAKMQAKTTFIKLKRSKKLKYWAKI